MADHTHVIEDITDFPTSLPASDVPAWAKAKRKPIYCWSDIHCKPNVITSVTVDGEPVPCPNGELKLEDVTKGVEKSFNIRFNTLAKAMKISTLTDDLQFGQRIRALEIAVNDDVNSFKQNYSTLVAQNTKLVSDFNTISAGFKKLDNDVTRRVNAIEVVANSCIRNCEARNLAQDQAILDAIKKAEDELGFAKRELYQSIASCKSSCADVHNRLSAQVYDLEQENFQQGREIVWLKEHVLSNENDIRNLKIDIAGELASSPIITGLRSDVDDVSESLNNFKDATASSVTSLGSRMAVVEESVTINADAIEEVRNAIPTVPTKLSEFTNDLELDFTKVETSSTNGNIKVNNTEVKVYDDSSISSRVQALEESSTNVTASPVNGSIMVDGVDVQVYDETALKAELEALKGASTKVTSSTNNGYIKVDGKDIRAYDDTAIKAAIKKASEGLTEVKHSENNGYVNVDDVDVLVYDDSLIKADILGLKNADVKIKNDIKTIQEAGYVTADEAKELATFEMTQSGKGSVTNLTVTGSQGTLIVNGENVNIKGTTDTLADLEAEVTTLKTRLLALEAIVAEITQTDCAALKTKVDALVEQVADIEEKADASLEPVTVTTLPDTGETGKIYLMKSSDEGVEGNRYDEYVWVDGKYERLGSSTDAPVYYSAEELNEMFNS